MGVLFGVSERGFPRALSKLYGYIKGTADGGILGVAEEVAGLTVTERGCDRFRTIVFDLVNVPVPVVSVTTGRGVGGLKLYTLPAGRILFFGAMGEISLSIASGKQADFTDATPEGDIGLGSLAPANADALGTDATDDDYCTAIDFTMSSYAVASRNLISEATQHFDGTSTAKPVFLNLAVDAADIDDGVTTEVLATGRITFHYLNLGDVT